MILLNDFKRQYSSIKDQIQNAVDAVGESGWLILGKEVQVFEETIQRMLQCQYAIGCASGLDALELAMRALDVKSGDKILTTPLSAFATTLAILRIGAKPVFVDVDATGLIELNQCDAVLKQDPNIKFMIPVHLYGHALNLTALRQLKQKYQIHIIEDCAQAICANSAGQPVGSVGDLAACSLYPTKNLGCFGDGGFVMTNNTVYAEKIKSLRDYGQTTKYEHTILGMNSRLDELQAAILNRALLPKLHEFTQRRKDIAKAYLQNINNPLIQLPEIPKDSDSVWHLFPTLSEDRDAFQTFLKQNDIQSAVHYPKLITDQAALTDVKDSYEIYGALDMAQKFARCELSLPLNPFLTDEEVSKVIKVCNQWKA